MSQRSRNQEGAPPPQRCTQNPSAVTILESSSNHVRQGRDVPTPPNVHVERSIASRVPEVASFLQFLFSRNVNGATDGKTGLAESVPLRFHVNTEENLQLHNAQKESGLFSVKHCKNFPFVSPHPLKRVCESDRRIDTGGNFVCCFLSSIYSQPEAVGVISCHAWNEKEKRDGGLFHGACVTSCVCAQVNKTDSWHSADTCRTVCHAQQVILFVIQVTAV